MPSVTCLRLIDVSVICRVNYFQFSIQSTLLPYLSPGSTSAHWFMQYGTSDVPKKFGNDFELILTVKMKTRHPVEGSFGSEFPAMCNHCVVMAALSHKT